MSIPQTFQEWIDKSEKDEPRSVMGWFGSDGDACFGDLTGLFEAIFEAGKSAGRNADER